jgi:hypothetical protein
MPAAVNTPRAIALAGPPVVDADMIWTYSVPSTARGVPGAALAAVAPVTAPITAMLVMAAVVSRSRRFLRMTDLFHGRVVRTSPSTLGAGTSAGHRRSGRSSDRAVG